MSLAPIHFSVTAKHRAVLRSSISCQDSFPSRYYLYIYIYICIYWPFLAQTLTPLEAFLPPYVEGLIPLPSPIMMFIQSTLRLHGHSSLMMSCYNKSISGYDLLLFEGKIPFPYIALALCSTWSHHSVRFWHLLFYFIHSVVAMWVTCETLSSGMMLML